MIRPLLITLVLTATAPAQWVVVYEYPIQCYPGGNCCPPRGYYDDGGYSQPPVRPRPNGVPTPPVGSPGTPEFAPCPPLPTPPQPDVPPLTNPTPPVPSPQPPAKPCDCGPKWESLEKWKIEFEATIIAAIKANAGKPGPPGPAGPAGPVGPQGPAPPAPPAEQPDEGEQHVVIVADQNSPYWQRLAEAVARTKQTYHGIQVTGLPKFPVGTHPQAVVYRNSVPVRLVKGQYEVEALLSRLSRGEAI